MRRSELARWQKDKFLKTGEWVVTQRHLAQEVLDVLELKRESDGNISKEATKIVRVMIDVMKKALERGDYISIAGFGKFKVKTRKPSRFKAIYFHGKDKTKWHREMSVQPARKYVVFRPSNVLTRMVDPTYRW